MRLVFCGTPQFAIPTLEQLLEAGHTIELVVTQPDRVRGRDQDPSPPPVKLLAAAAGLPVVQPEKIKNNLEFRARLEAIKPDAIIVVAYGRIIPDWMLQLAAMGQPQPSCFAAPQIPWRRSHPVGSGQRRDRDRRNHHAHRPGPRHGRHSAAATLAIEPDQTAEQLFPLLAQSGASLMLETLDGLEAGTIHAVPQDDAGASLAPILEREDALVDFTRLAAEIYNRWRGFQPWPGAYAFFRGKKLTLHRLLPAGAAACLLANCWWKGAGCSWQRGRAHGWSCWRSKWKARRECR